MHREQLVERLRRHEVLVRPRELGADEHGLQPTEQEEEERGVEVQHPDSLVVDRGQPAPESGLFSGFGASVRR